MFGCVDKNISQGLLAYNAALTKSTQSVSETVLRILVMGNNITSHSFLLHWKVLSLPHPPTLKDPIKIFIFKDEKEMSKIGCFRQCSQKGLLRMCHAYVLQQNYL